MPSRKSTARKPTTTSATAARKPARKAAPAGARLSSIREPKRPHGLAAGTPAPSFATIAHKEIERTAYELWQRRGGDPLTNWIEAEAILQRDRIPVAQHRSGT